MKKGLVNVFGAPAAEIVAPMQQNLEQSDEASLMELDTRIADRADGDGQGEALQQREVHVDVQPLRLKLGETISDNQELPAHGLQVLQPFVEAKVAQVV